MKSIHKKQFYISIFMVMSVLLFAPDIVSAQETTSVGYGEVTSTRLRASLAAAIGVINAIFAGILLFRSAKHGGGRQGSMVAAAVGLAVVAYAGYHLATFTGTFGTGDGRAGVMVALLFGLVGMTVAGITLMRIRRKN